MRKFIGCALLAVCLVMTVAEIPKEFRELGVEVRRFCLDETGADVKLINKANESGELTDDAKLKCYMKCVLTQLGLFTRKGINYDLVLKLTPSEHSAEAKKVVDACRNTKATKEGDSCDLVYEAGKCFQRTDPERYFLL